MALLAPPGVAVILYDKLGDLPHFNPDLDVEAPPPAVQAFRNDVGLCDGLILCSPEYAHGVPGFLKNALDWLVGSLEFPGMPVALISGSPRAVHAQTQLREIMVTMSARLIEQACTTLSLPNNLITAQGIASDPQLADQLRLALSSFVRAITAGSTEVR
jgi:NAD(P)H-dependent FMN reductase